MNFFDIDKKYMKLALKEAKKAKIKGEFPVGAVLTIDDKVIGVASNNLKTNKNWSSHAEKLLIDRYSQEIRKVPTTQRLQIYTTLEPCLMCMGTIVLNKFDRLIYGCKDPFGGTTNLNLSPSLPNWYANQWPEIKSGILAKESYDLLINYMMENLNRWQGVLPSFLEMGRPKNK